MELRTSDVLTPLVPLVRLQAGLGAPSLGFVNPLVQLVRLQVGNGGPNLRFVNPSHLTR